VPLVKSFAPIPTKITTIGTTPLVDAGPPVCPAGGSPVKISKIFLRYPGMFLIIKDRK
jgi:hypothetical protein